MGLLSIRLSAVIGGDASRKNRSRGGESQLLGSDWSELEKRVLTFRSSFRSP
jgi:hypothetical protein